VALGSGASSRFMTPDGFRKLALTLPQSHELLHHNHPDFRVSKRVFATLGYPDSSWGMVKLTPMQQVRFVALHPKVFVAVKGAWGARGSTNVKLSSATRAALWPALLDAWKNTASASVRAQLQDPAA
jgi:hypothetical protein